MLENHISVCVCTYKRPKLLAKLLDEIQNQKTLDLFTYSVVVVDNDKQQTVKNIVESIQKNSNIEIAYYVETRRGISHARNKTIEKAKGNFIAFIDDDEFPEEDWLLNLFNTCIEFDADGVIGNVLPYFEESPPDWLRKGKFGFKHSGKTGTCLATGSTSNAFIKKSVTEFEKPSFDPDFGLSGGEDSVFFQRLIKNGYVFVACAEAIVHEFVPSQRMSKTYLLKRYLLEGANTIRIFRITESFASKMKLLLKSVVAIVAYSISLPVLFLLAKHLFMKYLLKISYWGGVLLESIHISPIPNRSSLEQSE